MIVDALLAGVAVLARPPRTRALATAGALVLTPTLLLVQVWDTPQLHPGLLEQSLLTLEDPHADAVLGLSTDGGYWAVGLMEALTGRSRQLWTDAFVL